MEEMEVHGLYFDQTFPIFSDRNDGYLFCIDSKNSMAALTTPNTVHIFALENLVACEFREIPDEMDSRYYKELELVLDLSSDPNRLVIPLAKVRNRRKGIIGSAIISSGKTLEKVIQEEIERFTPTLPEGESANQ